MEGWCAELECALEWVQKSTHRKHNIKEEVLSVNMILLQEKGTEEVVHISQKVINTHEDHATQIGVVVIMRSIHLLLVHHLLVVAGLVGVVTGAQHTITHHLYTPLNHLMLKIFTLHQHHIEDTREATSRHHMFLMTDTVVEMEQGLLADIHLVLTGCLGILHQLRWVTMVTGGVTVDLSLMKLINMITRINTRDLVEEYTRNMCILKSHINIVYVAGHLSIHLVHLL